MNAANNHADIARSVFTENGTGSIRIKNQVYDAIIRKLTGHLFESGGIIGKDEHGIISDFIFDRGMTCSQYEYIPDITTLNAVIEAWDVRGISFCGFVHSHLRDDGRLSAADIEYAKKIIRNFDCLNELYMLIVVVDPIGKSKIFVHIVKN